MMENGSKTRSMGRGNSSILIRPDTMANGRKMLEEAMAPTTILTEISTKAIGIGICKTGLELTTTPMEISTRVNGSMVALTVKATTSILPNEGFTKVIGEKAGRRGSDSLSLRTSMDIQALGRIIKRMARAPISIPMAKDTKVIGLGIRSTDRESTGTKMEIPTTENGEMIIGMVTAPWSTTTAPSIGVSGKRESSRAEAYSTSATATRTTVSGCAGRCTVEECW